MAVEKLFTCRSSDQNEMKNNKLESKHLNDNTKYEKSSLEKGSMNIINDPTEESDEKKIENCDSNGSDGEEDIELIDKGLQSLQLEVESDSSKCEENDQDGLCSRGPIKWQKSIPIHSQKPYEFSSIIESPERLYPSSPEFATDISSTSPVSSYSSNSSSNFEQISYNESLPPDCLWIDNELWIDDIQISNQLSVSPPSNYLQNDIIDNNLIIKTSDQNTQSSSENKEVPINILLDDVDEKFRDIKYVKEVLNMIGTGNSPVSNYLPKTVQEVNERAAVQEIIPNQINPPSLPDIHITEIGNNELIGSSFIFTPIIKKNYPKKILPNGGETRIPFSILGDLKKKMNENVYKKAQNTLKTYSIAQLTKGDDKDNDTELMVMCTKNLTNKLEKVIALINQIRDEPGALEHENNRGLDALYHACFFMTDQPLVACYITEILAEKSLYIGSTVKCSLKGKYEKGDTIIHMIARRGDYYADLLANLLLFQKVDGFPFNLEARNEEDETPLYVAVKVHGENNIRSIEIVKQLVLNNAKKYYEKKCPMLLALKKDPLIFEAITKYKNKHDYIINLNFKN